MWFLYFLLIAVSASNADAVSNTCPPGHHWVKEHHRRAYYRAEGTLVSAADVAAHCRKNPSGFHSWSGLLKEGRPPSWRRPNEQSKNWLVEETERMLEALGETPTILKEQGIDGFFRMAKADAPGNPASLRGTNVVVYDDAFEKEHVLAHVLAHEQHFLNARH